MRCGRPRSGTVCRESVTYQGSPGRYKESGHASMGGSRGTQSRLIERVCVSLCVCFSLWFQEKTVSQEKKKDGAIFRPDCCASRPFVVFARLDQEGLAHARACGSSCQCAATLHGGAGRRRRLHVWCCYIDRRRNLGHHPIRLHR